MSRSVPRAAKIERPFTIQLVIVEQSVFETSRLDAVLDQRYNEESVLTWMKP